MPKLDVMCFCETFLNENISNAECMIPGYSLVGHDRKGKTGGGVIAYVSINISYTHRVDLQTEETESIWLQVHLKNSKDILLGIIYRPPNSLATWYEKFEAELENATRRQQTYY